MKNYSIVDLSDQESIGIADVIDWCESHPGERLDHTMFRPKREADTAVASDTKIDECPSFYERNPLGTWPKKQKGWEWIPLDEDCDSFFIHKGDRIILLTY